MRPIKKEIDSMIEALTDGAGDIPAEHVEDIVEWALENYDPWHCPETDGLPEYSYEDEYGKYSRNLLFVDHNFRIRMGWMETYGNYHIFKQPAILDEVNEEREFADNDIKCWMYIPVSKKYATSD